MIYAFTSKKNGCGRSALSLLTSLLVAEEKNKSVILLDLSNSGDLFSLLSKDKTLASIDALMAGIVLETPDLGLSDNVVTIGILNVIPGTRSKLSSFLYKRYMDVIKVLEYINSRFNSVIIDVDEELLNLIEMNIPNIKRVNVLEQDILNVRKYKKEISEGSFNGFYVVNNFKELVFPQMNFFSRNFTNSQLVVIPSDEQIATLLNKSEINVKAIKSSLCYEGLDSLSKSIIADSSVVNSSYANKFKRPSLLDLLFKSKSVLSKRKGATKNE